MTEPTDNYSDFYDDNGQPVRRGVVLTDVEQSIYDQYFAPTTEETN